MGGRATVAVMLIEHRTYTLRLGSERLFWQAQALREPDGLAPILERAIGLFAVRTGPTDQIVGLYRYDDFEDWRSRLLGLPARPQLRAYFEAVRPLIVRQESRFVTPAPIDELSPVWRHGSADWRPADGPLLAFDPTRARLEQTVLTFSAGGVASCWEAARQSRLHEDPVAVQGWLGAFVTLVGPLNEVMILRAFEDEAALADHRVRRAASGTWQRFLTALSPLVQASDTKVLAPAPISDMAALFPPTGNSSQ